MDLHANVLYELIVCNIDLFVSAEKHSYRNSEDAGKQSFKVKETSVERYVNVQCCPRASTRVSLVSDLCATRILPTH